jgi:mitogen-activated protein kinase kinase kinase 9
LFLLFELSLGVCLEKDNYCIIMEFAEKGSLYDLLHNQTIQLDWKQKYKFALEAALGLNYLHSHPNGAILHRDVKSLNCLIDEHNILKISDFGLSTAKTKLNQKETVGTIQWCAPGNKHRYIY